MDWNDRARGRTLKSVTVTAARREFLEEWGKKHPHKPPIRITRIEPIGYFRMPHRGGKPQFVALAKFENPVRDLHPGRSRSVKGDDAG